MFNNTLFTSPYYILISCIFLGILAVVWFFPKKKFNILSFQDIKSVYGIHSFWYVISLFFIVCITLLFWVILSSPVSEKQEEKIKKNGIDMNIVLDVSYSMIAQDISPSRIESAKKVLQDFLWNIQTDRVGIILFSGKPFTSVPLNFDYWFLSDFVSEISVDIINQDRPHLSGTAIWDALMLSSHTLLQDNSEREKVIILITDWEANRGIDPLVALAYLKEKNIKVYTIGIGKDEETFIELSTDLWFIQRIPIGAVDEKTLQKISFETGGKYFRGDSENTLEDIFNEIQLLEKTEIEVEQIQMYTSQLPFWYTLISIFIASFLFIYFRKNIRF